MREHLYRALIDTRGSNKPSVWVYGAVAKFENVSGEIYTAILPEIDGQNLMCELKRVIPETVCEYTGRDAYLKSKEIVPCKLFEGDICEVTVFDHNGIDTQHICKIEYLGSSFYFVGTDKYDFYLPLSDVDDTESDVEVIGTIFDEGERE